MNAECKQQHPLSADAMLLASKLSIQVVYFFRRFWQQAQALVYCITTTQTEQETRCKHLWVTGAWAGRILTIRHNIFIQPDSHIISAIECHGVDLTLNFPLRGPPWILKHVGIDSEDFWLKTNLLKLQD